MSEWGNPADVNIGYRAVNP